MSRTYTTASRWSAALLLSLLVAAPTQAAETLSAAIDRLADAVESQVIADRRHFHEHPELSNREFETARVVAERLTALGFEVQTGVAHTGVVGVLRGGRPGGVVALRADMDALPVVEDTDLPFKSTVRAEYEGEDVGVMHACGHDAHTGMLLGVASVLATLRPQLPGTVKLIFQPAEEGAPSGEQGGAALMIEQGVLDHEPKPSAIFGLHVMSGYDVGQLAWRSGGAAASSDDFVITIHGRQTHGAYPWLGVDPIVVASQVVLGLQTIPSRQMDASKAPVVVSVGRIEGGVRYNIIPDRVTLTGTLRALDPAMRLDLHERVRRTAEQIAASAGARAEVRIGEQAAYPVVYNDPELTTRMLPTLRRVAGDGLTDAVAQMGSEDFAFFQQKIPGLYVMIGIRTPGADAAQFPSNHSPRFRIDENGLKLGVRTLAHLAVDYLQQSAATEDR